jgi:hypothetical protein
MRILDGLRLFKDPVGFGTERPIRNVETASLRILPGAAPEVPLIGDLLIDTSDSNTFKWFDGTVWKTPGQPTPVATGDSWIRDGNIFGANSYIGLTDNFNLGLVTNNTPRVMIAATGEVSIGSEDVKDPLYLKATTSRIAAFTNTSRGNTQVLIGGSRDGSYPAIKYNSVVFDFVNCGDGSANNSFSQYLYGLPPQLSLYGNGNVGIGTTSAATRRLEVVGDGIRISPSETPKNPKGGDIYIDSKDGNLFKWFDGSSWRGVAGSGGGSLNSAYNFGGGGLGRVITARDGEVRINGVNLPLKLTTSANSTWTTSLVLESSTGRLNPGEGLHIMMGDRYVTNQWQGGSIGYIRVADQDPSNYLSLGLWKEENILAITGNRRVGVNSVKPEAPLEVYDASNVEIIRVSDSAGSAGIYLVSEDPNNKVKGLKGSLALNQQGSIHVCRGGTVWEELVTRANGTPAT